MGGSDIGNLLEQIQDLTGTATVDDDVLPLCNNSSGDCRCKEGERKTARFYDNIREFNCVWDRPKYKVGDKLSYKYLDQTNKEISEIGIVHSIWGSERVGTAEEWSDVYWDGEKDVVYKLFPDQGQVDWRKNDGELKLRSLSLNSDGVGRYYNNWFYSPELPELQGAKRGLAFPYSNIYVYMWYDVEKIDETAREQVLQSILNILEILYEKTDDSKTKGIINQLRDRIFFDRSIDLTEVDELKKMYEETKKLAEGEQTKLEGELKTANDDKKSLSDKIAGIESDLATKDGEKKELQRQLDEALLNEDDEATISDLRGKIKDAEDRESDLSLEKVSLEETNKSLDARIITLLDELSKTTSPEDRKVLEERIEELEQENRDKKTESEGLDVQIKEKDDALKKAGEDLATAQNNQADEATIADLQGQVSTLTQSEADLKKQKQDLEGGKSDLEKRIGDLEETLKNSTTPEERVILQERIDALTATQRDVDEITQLNARIAELEADDVVDEAEIARLTAVIAELQNIEDARGNVVLFPPNRKSGGGSTGTGGTTDVGGGIAIIALIALLLSGF